MRINILRFSDIMCEVWLMPAKNGGFAGRPFAEGWGGESVHHFYGEIWPTAKNIPEPGVLIKRQKKLQLPRKVVFKIS